MTALSFVWVYPYSKNSRCDTNIHLVTRMPARASLGGFHPPCSWFPFPPNYTADRHVQEFEVILPRVLIIKGGPDHLPQEWLDWAWDRMLTAEASLGMVLASEDKAAPQWHLDGMQGDEPRKHPFLSPQASIWEQCQELLLDLLLGLDALC